MWSLRKKQLTNTPVKIAEDTLPVLDVITSNRCDLINYTHVISCQMADHELLTITVDIKKPKRQPVIKS